MNETAGIFIGRGETPLQLLLSRANRHGLIAGTTGTGKTVTLQILAEGLSRAGVPVFLADAKGDLSGLSHPGEAKPKLIERAEKIGLEGFAPAATPTLFWDLFGEQGHPVRTTISDMGPLLLSNLLELNEAQEGVLNIAFRISDEQGLLLLDLKDLRAILSHVGENAKELTLQYGNVSAASVGAILRRLLVLEQQGAEQFFGEPALELADLMRCDFSGQGAVSVLAADRLMQSPRLYATALLWLLSELFEELPEVGDPDKPKLVLFFDEAHLLFDDAPEALVDKIEQVVRLIRSKGVGIYFVTQNPLDIPDKILGQLGNRIQHALRAYTPREQKAVRAVAQTMRANPNLETETAILELGVGEALVSLLDEKGRPGVVQRALIRPPASRMGPATPEERRAVLGRSPVGGRYDKAVDRESAYEKLSARAEQAAAAAEKAKPEKKAAKPARGRQGYGESVTKSVMRSIGSQIGRQIVRGLLGSLFRGR
ncbi:MAG: ATP-binding protein [Desulfuromonas sp.]|uniref:helicase HerA-like domain-containing protein n=1 Tax=Desulfuromonas sp. TaxID=892 RepID=UPI000CC4DCF0|nr:helicase HerA-like domain-containing protein [Desulfuromonas sp.]PLX82384.1 MAG: ATP-binding protein [Desulfuromonas sp.]